MFRQMRRFKQQVSTEKCIEILKNEWRGVLALLGDDGYPYTVPIDFFMMRTTEKFIFTLQKKGTRLMRLKNATRLRSA